MDPVKPIAAVEELRQAAEGGDPKAQSDLGWRYHSGDGVPKDIAEALRWYRLAAEQGETSAQNRIGVCYEKGVGVEQDFAQAVHWYRQAADLGNSKAQNNLGHEIFEKVLRERRSKISAARLVEESRR